MESVKNNYSIGMRFKMRFEGEEAPEQRFTGTIVGIEDADSTRWKESKWRSLKVRWDETSSIPRPERVSPWKIEPALAPPTLNHLPVSRPKRPRPAMVQSSPDSSVLTREGSSRVTIDLPPTVGYSRVLQGQEFPTLRGNFTESNDSETAEKSVMWPPSADDEKTDVLSGSRRFLSENWVHSRRQETSYIDLLSGFGANTNASAGFCASYADQSQAGSNTMKKQILDQERQINLLPRPWPLMPLGVLSLKLSDSSSEGPLQGDLTFQGGQSIRYSAFTEYPMAHGHRVEQSHANWLMPPPASHFDSHVQAREPMPKHTCTREQDAGKSMDGSCKLFGIFLANHVSQDFPVSHRISNSVDEAAGPDPTNHQICTWDSNQNSEHPIGSKMAEDNENEKQTQGDHTHARDSHKAYNSSTRSCTKVHKQGIALGRSVDLAKFNNYDELTAELDRLFEFGGELMSSTKNWLVVYTDDESDMMLVGDDPWQEFVGMVRKIFIYTREEVQKMSPRTFNLKSDDNSSEADTIDAKETNP